MFDAPRLRARSLPLTTAILATACTTGDATAGPDAGGVTSPAMSSGEHTSTETTVGDEANDGSMPPTSGSETSDSVGSTSAEGEPPPVCGDGHLDPTEECDHGEALNDDHEFCTDACVYNVCGDGLLFAGHEDCDHGEANSDEFGSVCTEDCGPGAWCGDGIVQPEHEQCDNGPGNDTPEVDEQGLSCDKTCKRKARRLFITSHSYTGQLGGLLGADEKCRQSALDAELPEAQRFVALLSDAGTSMKTRYEDKLDEPLPYVLISGMKIADSYADLLESGPGPLGIHLSEKNEPVAEKFVASNTAANGSIHQEFDGNNALIVTDCDGWSTDAKSLLGRLGVNAVATDDTDYAEWMENKHWLSKSNMSCNTPMHLYCIEL